MRILIVSPYLPHRAVGHGGGTAIHHMVVELAREHEVRVLCFQRSGEEGLEAGLEAEGVQVDLVAYRSGFDRGSARVLTALDRVPRVVLSALTGRPYRSVRYAHRGMQRRLEEIVARWDPDAVQFEYFAMAPYAKRLRERRTGPRPLLALSTHEVETLVRMRRLFAASGGWRRLWADLELRRIRAYESRACSWADRILCVTPQDAEILRGLSGEGGIRVLPLGLRLESLREALPASSPNPRFLFVGSFDHPPNREAASWLLASFAPWMRESFPDAVLELAGPRPDPAWTEEAERFGGAVRILGFVEDLDPLFDRTTLFVAPLSSGGGIKIKILEALARGVPVLTTPIGLDGIAARPGVECARAEPGDRFLRECGRLLSAPEQLREMGRRGREFIAREHDWPALARRQVELFG